MYVPDTAVKPFKIEIPNAKKRREFLLREFKNHIGLMNAIGKKELAEKIFGKMDKMDIYQQYHLYDEMKKDFKYLRKKTKCFIAFEIVNTKAVYFIPRTMKEAGRYIGSLTHVIKGSKYMINRCEKAVSQKWYQKF